MDPQIVTIINRVCTDPYDAALTFSICTVIDDIHPAQPLHILPLMSFLGAELCYATLDMLQIHAGCREWIRV